MSVGSGVGGSWNLGWDAVVDSDHEGEVGKDGDSSVDDDCLGGHAGDIHIVNDGDGGHNIGEEDEGEERGGRVWSTGGKDGGSDGVGEGHMQSTGERWRDISPLLSLSNSTAHRLFATLLVRLAGSGDASAEG